MAEFLKTVLTEEELLNGNIPTNHVLCEVYYSNEGAKTKSGIIFGVNNDVNYKDSENLNDTSSHPADMAEVSLIVTKLPNKLYFNTEDETGSMPWEVEEMELCEEDVVWTNPIEALNAMAIECEGKTYKLIPYRDIYCAKREIWVNKWEGTKKTIVVMLNGYTLGEEIHKKPMSALDVTSEDKIEQNLVKLSFIGSPNLRHIREEYQDFIDLKGDTVVVDKKFKPFYLERTTYASKFDENKLYVVVPRRRIIAVINREA
jgi:hypothetical protein